MTVVRITPAFVVFVAVAVVGMSVSPYAGVLILPGLLWWCWPQGGHPKRSA